MDSQISNIFSNFQFSCSKDTLIQFLNLIPIKVHIFKKDGTSVFVNKIICEELEVDASAIVGIYNFFEDPIFGANPKFREFTRSEFNGDNCKLSIRIVLENINRCLPNKHFSGVKYLELSSFSVADYRNQENYIVIVYVTNEVYDGIKEVVKAKEYMNSNWLDEFNLNIIAEVAGLSASHFTKLFKENMEQTPYEYYKMLKIEKLKERLRNPNLNVSSAFLACGLDYNGRYRKFFKDAVGMTPSEYWDKNKDINFFN